MLYTIRNDSMQVTIDDLGAQIMSITASDGLEYLWNGDSAFWGDRAPVLFPYVGRLTEGSYTLHGKRYEMGIHGFAARSQFMAVAEDEDRLILALADSPETRKNYPFAFDFSVCFELDGTTLNITYAVENRSREPMYFGLGGHPGFRVPLEKGRSFEDYRLTFSHSCRPFQVDLSDSCMVLGHESPYALENGTTLPLHHRLFDRDAVILDHVDKTVTLSAGEGTRGVTVSFPMMRYLGIWHTTGSDAPFVCLEPWCSLPSRLDVVEDISQQGDLITLLSGETYINPWSITIF